MKKGKKKKNIPGFKVIKPKKNPGKDETKLKHSEPKQ